MDREDSSSHLDSVAAFIFASSIRNYCFNVRKLGLAVHGEYILLVLQTTSVEQNTIEQ